MKRSIRQQNQAPGWLLGMAASFGAATLPGNAEDFSRRCFGASEAEPARRLLPAVLPATAPDRPQARHVTHRLFRRWAGLIACAAAKRALFPDIGSEPPGRAASCNSFCPASVHQDRLSGSTIDPRRATESGKPYSGTANAFRYAKEIVAGCTCNGRTRSVWRRQDRRRSDASQGDMRRRQQGLVVAGRGGRQARRPLSFSPALRSGARAPIRAYRLLASE